MMGIRVCYTGGIQTVPTVKSGEVDERWLCFVISHTLQKTVLK